MDAPNGRLAFFELLVHAIAYLSILGTFLLYVVTWCCMAWSSCLVFLTGQSDRSYCL